MNTAIEGLFATGWGTTTPVRYDNVPFTAPDSSAWVSVEVWDGRSIKGSLGAGVQLRRSVGTVFVTIYTPINNGSKAARDYADQVVLIFRDVQVSGITFEEPDVSRIGEAHYTSTGAASTGTALLYQLKVAISFHMDLFE